MSGAFFVAPATFVGTHNAPCCTLAPSNTGEPMSGPFPLTKAHRAALLSAAGTLVVIAAVTAFVLANAAALNGSVLVPGLLDIAFHYNPGISFGLFAQDTQTGSRLLIAVATLFIGLLCWFAWKATRPLIDAGLGMLIAGALVNVVDRALHGAVFDYLVVHLGPQPLFVCNAPDVAISVGFALWLAGEYLPPRVDQG